VANEEDRTVIEGADAEKAKADAAKPGGVGKKKLIILGAIGFAAILVGVVVALFVLKPMMSDSGQTETATPESNKAEEQKAEPEKEKKPKKDHGEEGGAGHSFVYNIDDIVINPAGTGGTRFLSASFAFELESEAARSEFEAREAIVRDALITILSSKTITQLTDTRQKEIARYQIKKRISEILNTEELSGVFYTDFVLQ